MRQVRIFNKEFSQLTAFLEGEFGALSYMDALGEVGSAEFILDIANEKVTDANLRHYNRVEILEEGVVQWVGYIARKSIEFNTVRVRCRSLIGLFKKRITGSPYTLSGDAGQAVSTLLSDINSSEDTGIAFGIEDISATINMTFDSQDAFYVLTKIADVAGAQFEVDTERSLSFKSQIGEDLSESIVFRYNIAQIEQANILNFNVDDDGDEIVTKAYGKSDALTSSQEDTALKAKFGLLETFKNFRVANVQGDLDALTDSEVKDAAFSPRIELSPNIKDTFKVGDVVRVQLLNKLINIDGDFQILEKSVKVVNRQKLISVKISNLTQDVVRKMRDLESRLALLESKV